MAGEMQQSERLEIWKGCTIGISYYKICMSVCVSVCVYIRNTLPNHVYYGNITFTSNSLGPEEDR